MGHDYASQLTIGQPFERIAAEAARRVRKTALSTLPPRTSPPYSPLTWRPTDPSRMHAKLSHGSI